MIDADHLLDYYLQEGLSLKIKNIYLWHSQRKARFIFLFYHSLELVLLLWVIISVFRLGLNWIALGLGITQHMVLDILTNPLYSCTYFLSYRLFKGFKREHLARVRP
ncbi:MAG: hypothetical protein HZC16_03590 [Candidatus Omnitrophica bacterium]|nr:hypothetical protein [Candidatus Omnitrophota bacterium]